MSEQDGASPEAVAAGTAAAIAVEEIQSREETEQAAETAVIEADVALTSAAIAEETAQAAEFVSSEAFDAAQTAIGAAAETRDQVETLAYVTAAQLQELRQEHTDSLRELRDFIDSRIPAAPAETEPDFTEVEASSGIRDSGRAGSAGATGNQSSEESDGAETGDSQKSGKYGLRHRRR